MGKIKIVLDENSKIEKISADCLMLEEKQEINGKLKVVKYELYGYSEITDTIIGNCVMQSENSNEVKYYIVNDDYTGKFPINLEEEFYNFFAKDVN